MKSGKHGSLWLKKCRLDSSRYLMGGDDANEAVNMMIEKAVQAASKPGSITGGSMLERPLAVHRMTSAQAAAVLQWPLPVAEFQFRDTMPCGTVSVLWFDPQSGHLRCKEEKAKNPVDAFACETGAQFSLDIGAAIKVELLSRGRQHVRVGFYRDRSHSASPSSEVSFRVEIPDASKATWRAEAFGHALQKLVSSNPWKPITFL